MRYKTSEGLDRAIKAAAQASPMDTGRAYAGFFFHRLLCRVFSDPDSRFLLKGGLSMLARTIDARATRDIDLLSTGDDLEEAVEELKRLASVDLGDFVTFSFAGMAPIKAEDEYRSGMNVRSRSGWGTRGSRISLSTLWSMTFLKRISTPSCLSIGLLCETFRHASTACMPWRARLPTSSAASWNGTTTGPLRDRRIWLTLWCSPEAARLTERSSLGD